MVATYFGEGSTGEFGSPASSPIVFTECGVSHFAGVGEVAVVTTSVTVLLESVDTALFVATAFEDGGGFAFANSFYSIAASSSLVATTSSQAHVDLTPGVTYTFAPGAQTLDAVNVSDLLCSTSVMIVRAAP